MKGPNDTSGVSKGDSLAHKSLFLCRFCKNLCYCNKSGRCNTLVGIAHILASMSGSWRCQICKAKRVPPH
ncbi:hypothetical protein BC830DRAFT_1129780, partial [Chytriomyces sp. MP71]